MKHLSLLLMAVVALTLSCATSEKSNTASFLSINRPSVRIEANLRLDQSNLMQLGPIDETVEMTKQAEEAPDFFKPKTVSIRAAYIPTESVTQGNALAKTATLYRLRLRGIAARIVLWP